MAEEQRFELWNGFPSTVFKTVAFSHSATLRNDAHYKQTSFTCKARERSTARKPAKVQQTVNKRAPHPLAVAVMITKGKDW